MSSDSINGINPLKPVNLAEPTETQRSAASGAQDSLPTLLSSSSAQQTASHTLARGENLSKIAKRYNVTVEELLKANPQIQDANLVQVGQIIIIPAKQTAQAPTATTKANTHKIAAGENLNTIAKKYGVNVAAILEANPKIKDANKIGAGMTIIIPTTPTTAPAAQKNGVTTLKSYTDNQSEEIKAIKSAITKSESKEAEAYFAPEGKLTIGIGHQMPENGKPQFLKDIENSLKPMTDKQKKEYDKIDNNTALSEADKKKEKAKLDKKREYTPAEKATKLKEALKKKENADALKAAIKKELDAAAKNTGIKDVATTVAADRKLTEDQMQLLLNSDVKTAETAAKSAIGATAYSKATSGQRQVALDLQYNTGSIQKKAPKFVKYFKESKMDDAQAELDVFKANGKIQLGLIRRNYQRMILMNENGTLSDKSKEKLLKAYNIDRLNKGKPAVATFEDALKDIQKT